MWVFSNCFEYYPTSFTFYKAVQPQICNTMNAEKIMKIYGNKLRQNILKKDTAARIIQYYTISKFEKRMEVKLLELKLRKQNIRVNK